MDKLKEFMKGRPHDKKVPFEEAVIEYIEQVEKKSMERGDKLENHLNIVDKDNVLVASIGENDVILHNDYRVSNDEVININ